MEGNKTKTTDYIGGLVYENNVLQFVPTAEGRMVFQTPPSGAGGLYQYHYKDHLGNVRMTFAPDVPQTERLSLTAEVDSANKEEKDFSNLVATRTSEKSLAGVRAAKINSQQSVSSRLLKVQKGGSLAIEAFATFDNEKIVQPIDNVPTIAEKVSKMAITAGALLSVQDINFGNETKSKSLNFNFLAAVPFVKTLLSKTKSKDNITIPYKPQKPKAYIEIVIYADSLQTELLSAKQLPISDKGEYFWEQLQDSLLIEEDGFAVVSLRNESEKEVLFDELNVTVYGTERATIIQENHYEPFGMTLKGLDYVLEEKQKNKFLYNGGVERQDELDLYWDDSHARGYNMQTGRFEQIDPLADEAKQESWTSYHYSFNNPILYNDPYGDCPTCAKGEEALKNYIVGAIVTNPDGGYWKLDEKGNWQTVESNTQATTESTQGSGASTDTMLDVVQTGLDVVGLVPGFGEAADGINAGIYALRGDYTNAGLSLAAMVPLAGWGATLGKIINKGLAKNAKKISKSSDDLVTIYRGVNSSAGEAYTDALSGVVQSRGGFFGHTDALMHNRGANGTISSNFTSWTTDPDVALNYAYRKNGTGVLMTMQVPRSVLVNSPNTKVIQLYHQPDKVVSESEVLLKGAWNNIDFKTVKQ